MPEPTQRNFAGLLISARERTMATTEQPKLTQYDFTLKFALDRHDADPEAYIERLIASGCDDALIGIGERGRVALNFTRESESAVQAVLSAIHDVRRAISSATFVEATPDLVGFSDIASLLGFTRQYMRKLAEEGGPKFPLPVHDGKRAIYHLEAVLYWLMDRGRHVDVALLETAIVNRQLNFAREQARLKEGIPEGFKRAVA